MNAVVPVEIMVGRRAVPTAIVIFEGIVSPQITGIGSAHDNSVPCKAHCPYLTRFRITDAGFNGGDDLRLLYGARLGQSNIAMHERAAFDALVVGAQGERQRYIKIALH